jgi:hypothetical protein
LNKHNFTIFDARRLATDISHLSLPLITEAETKAELSFLEILARMPGKVQIPCNRKRKCSEFEGERMAKRAKTDFDTTAVTQRLLDILSTRPFVHIQEIGSLLQVKETKVQQIVDVLAVVGSALISDDGFVSLRRYGVTELRSQTPETENAYDIFGAQHPPSTLLMDYVDSLEANGPDFENSHAPAVVLPFSRPSSLLTSLVSPTPSHTSTLSSSSSSESSQCEVRSPTSSVNSFDNLSYISFSGELTDRDCSDGWADSFWNH